MCVTKVVPIFPIKYFYFYLVVSINCYTFVLWRGGRVVDCGGLENR